MTCKEQMEKLEAFNIKLLSYKKQINFIECIVSKEDQCIYLTFYIINSNNMQFINIINTFGLLYYIQISHKDNTLIEMQIF